MTSRILARCLLGATLLMSVAPASAMAIADFGGHISGSGPDAGVSVAVYIYNSAKKYVATGGPGFTGNYFSPSLAPGGYFACFENKPGTEATDFYVPQCYSGAPSLNEAAVIGLTEGETTEKVDAAMVQGGIIHGTVTDSSTGKGIPNLTVTVLGASPRICVATGEPTCTAGGVTGTTGAYGTRVLASGLYELQFSGNPAYKEKTVSASAPVASLTTLDVSLEPAGTGGGSGRRRIGRRGGIGRRRIGRIGRRRIGRIRGLGRTRPRAEQPRERLWELDRTRRGWKRVRHDPVCRRSPLHAGSGSHEFALRPRGGCRQAPNHRGREGEQDDSGR